MICSRHAGRTQRKLLLCALMSALALPVVACGLILDYPSSEPEQSAVLCADHADNDFDDHVDCDDPDCDGFCSEESTIACGDRRDNDGDGLTDGADPRCWLLAPPEVQRCAEAAGLDLVETFDLFLQHWSAGSRVFGDYHQGGPGSRQDVLVGIASPLPTEMYDSWMSRNTAFAGSWQGFELAFSAAVPGNARLRASIAPIRLAPLADTPRPGAETALLSVSIDTTGVPAALVLDVEGRRYAAALAGAAEPALSTPGEDFSDVKVTLDKEGFRATLTRADGATTELRAPGPTSRSLGPVRLVFWGGSSSAGGGVVNRVGLDDLRLHVSGEQPCGFRAPQIPGPSCEYRGALDALGHQVSVARGEREFCALITASTDAYVDHPQALTAWSSPDGATWAPASSRAAPSLELPLGTRLVGAGIAHDGEAFHVVVEYREAEGTRLAFASGSACGGWGALEAGPLLPPDAEPPSYVITNGRHEIYFTLPPGENRTLWRVARDAGAWLEAARLTDLPPQVASPATVQRLGARDLVLVYPAAPSADESGIGVLVGDAGARSWQPLGASPFLVIPRPFTNPYEGELGFDGLGATSAALSWSGNSGFILYGGSSAYGMSYNGYHPLLSVGTARLAPSGQAFGESEPAPAAACGDGSCDVGESCSSCPADCACGGPALLTDAFTPEKPWALVSEDQFPAAVQYRDFAHGALNWAGASPIAGNVFGTPRPKPPPATWSVLPLGRSISGDFELSFDFLDNPIYLAPNLIGLGPLRCSLYVGLGAPPELGGEAGTSVVPPAAGVFARLLPSSCYGKYLARPSVHSSGLVFERDNDTLGDPYTCLLERHWPTSNPRKLRLRREGNQLSVGVVRDDGCGMAERTVDYSGALPDLPALLVGSGGGDYEACAEIHGVGSISNLELRLLADPAACPPGQALCGDGAQEPSCVDTARSNEHCGACAHACAAGEACNNGVCAAEPMTITWLSLDGDRAPAGVAPNDDFGINGKFLPDIDACASYQWDPSTRRISGKLCDLGRNYENFGMAIIFDFLHAAGEGTTLLWNPQDYGVRGLAWELSGAAPELQVWVLHMDPSWNGRCTTALCRVAGPGDGRPRASLQQQLFFDDMVKDTWGFNGIRYTFDPAAVFAFEFNIPTEQAPNAEFDFRIERVGLIR